MSPWLLGMTLLSRSTSSRVGMSSVRISRKRDANALSSGQRPERVVPSMGVRAGAGAEYEGRFDLPRTDHLPPCYISLRFGDLVGCCPCLEDLLQMDDDGEA